MGKAILFMYAGFFATVGGMVAVCITVGVIALAAAIFNRINDLRSKDKK